MAAVFSIGCAAPGAEAPNGLEAPAAAWWYGTEFEPASTDVHGIPVGRFDPGWLRASALGASDIPGQVPDDELARYANAGFSFELRSDLDRDGTEEEIFVGVFETDTGNKGRFLAVTRDGRLLKHFEHSGLAGFSTLMAGQGEVRWYKCMECGEFESLRWSGRSYVLE